MPVPGVPLDPATTVLAVTKARSDRNDAEWAAMNAYDPAFEEASSRFFETDPGNRLTFEHLIGDDAGGDGAGPEETNIPGLDPPRRGRVEHGHAEREAQGHDTYGTEIEPGYGDLGGHLPDRPVERGYPAGSGYEAVYGESAIDPVEPDVDDDELANGAAARRNAIEWAVVLVAAVLLALVLRALVLQAFYIPSPSMEDTLLIQDRVLVNKLSYRFGDVGRGDIVVFHRTDGEIAAAGPNQPKDVIKRVIALAGETIEIRESKVFINDEELVEPYLEPGLVMPDFGPVTVPDGFLFVMGDNRNLSSDSRGELGPIAEDRVVGRAFVLFWPVNRVSRL
ncbi:MAG: signal peptidase I [Acidimicrobiia bacterium]|nr:signal peptidase I [Acidimicrobiia bacterium]